MNYQVLARKWRPKSFSTLIGQEHVVRALINALDQDRLHHAYLFTGTRGVGKTTIARILAKCLNCESGITSNPCGKCNACQEIDTGRFIDLIEVDAASRTKVEDTRDLLDNVQYTPTKGRFKVYLIDEVHMLSSHSFNALLKTLEEPPPHVKFLLATTDPHKLPATVLSRCLQFNLKNMLPEVIAAHLMDVLGQEKIEFDEMATKLLARSANGSMRDGLSLLDQAIAFGNGKVLIDDIRVMLGTIEQTHLYELFESITRNDVNSLLSVINVMAEQATDFSQALEDFLSLIHCIAMAQAVPDGINDNEYDPARIKAIATSLTSEEVQLYYQIGLIGRRDLPLAPSAKAGFEMALLRMLAFRPGEITQSAAPNVAHVTQTPNTPKVSNASNAPQEWTSLLSQLKLTGPTKAFAAHCHLSEFTEDRMQLLLDPSQAPTLNDKHKQRIGDALTQHFNKPITLVIDVGDAGMQTPAAIAKQKYDQKQAIATEAIQKDPNVKTIIDKFNATILPNSIKAE